jgi:glycosyltransferase involved in cell wall biosynthesis
MQSTTPLSSSAPPVASEKNLHLQRPCRPTRVLFISHTPYLGGGADLCLLELLQGLDRRIIDPYVVLPRTWEDGPFASALSALSFPYTFRQISHWAHYGLVGSTSRWELAKKTLKGLRERVWAIATLVEREQIDAVYTNTVTVVEGALAARITRRPHVWHIHEAVRGNADLTTLLPDRMIRASISALSARVIFPSSFLAYRMYKYKRSSDRAVVIANGVDSRKFFPDPTARAWLSELANIPMEAPRVAIVGGLQARKRVNDFLRAVAISKARQDGACFLIVGQGREQEKRTLQLLTKSLGLDSSVRFLGWQSNIPRLLTGVDVLVVASEQETFGRTIVEAMACGVPVVSTRCGGPEELIADGETGLLVPVRAPASLATAIDRIIFGPSVAAAFSEAARKRVFAEFSLAQYVSRIEAVISDTVHPSAGGRRYAPEPVAHT